MLSFSHQPSSTQVSPPGSSAEPGPRPHPKGWWPSALGRWIRHLPLQLLWGQQVESGGVLTILLQPFSCPITITILCAMNPKFPGTSPHINLLSSPI